MNAEIAMREEIVQSMLFVGRGTRSIGVVAVGPFSAVKGSMGPLFCSYNETTYIHPT